MPPNERWPVQGIEIITSRQQRAAKKKEFYDLKSTTKRVRTIKKFFFALRKKSSRNFFEYCLTGSLGSFLFAFSILWHKINIFSSLFVFFVVPFQFREKECSLYEYKCLISAIVPEKIEKGEREGCRQRKYHLHTALFVAIHPRAIIPHSHVINEFLKAWPSVGIVAGAALLECRY